MKLTIALVALNVIIYLLTFINPQYFLDNFGFSINGFLSGKYYLLISSMFVHVNFVHLLGNMIALLTLGGAVESKLGKIKYLLIYFLSGVIGALSAFVPIFGYSPDIIFIGASGAISGLIGVGIFVCPMKWTLFPFEVIPIPFAAAAALYILYTIPLLFVQDGIAYPAHLSGMLTGVIFGILWGEKIFLRFLIFIFILILILALPLLLQVFL